MQLDDLRPLPLASLDGLNASSWYRLLNSPHQLQLESLPAVSSKDVRADALAASCRTSRDSTPAIIAASFCARCLNLRDSQRFRVCSSLACCVGLTSLELNMPTLFSSMHLASALHPMRSLRRLDLTCRSGLSAIPAAVAARPRDHAQ